MTGHWRRTRSIVTSLPAVVLIALAIRFAFLWQYQAARPGRALGVIPFLFEPGNIAASLAAGKGFSSPFRIDTGPTAWMTPVYPLVLAAVFRVFGAYTFPSFLAAASLNILFSALTCIPIWRTGNRIGGVPIASLAAWLWAVFPNAILIPVEAMWDTSLSTLLAALILWWALQLPAAPFWRNWLSYGFLWGLALMTSATLLALFPFLLGWAAYRLYEKHTPSWAAKPLCAAAVTLACCLPWTIRNFTQFNAFIPLRSPLGLQLWVGNNEHLQDRSPGALHPISSQTERARYIELGEVAYMREKQRQALDFILSHPALEAHLTVRRFLAVWSGGSPNPIADFLRSTSTGFRFVLLFNVLVAIGTAAGLFKLFRSGHPCAFPLAVFPLIYPIAYYLTLTSPRYRHPIDPELMLLTSAALLVRSPRADEGR